MTDIFSKEKRSDVMSRIRGKNTKPEMIVRKYLFSQGFRYRVHVKKLPGSPDIVLRKYRTVIFIHGCFWHGHSDDNCKIAHIPKTRSEWWQKKIERNNSRDKKKEKLRSMGWYTMVIWECQLSPKNKDATLEGIKNLLHKSYFNQFKTKSSSTTKEVH